MWKSSQNTRDKGILTAIHISGYYPVGDTLGQWVYVTRATDMKSLVFLLQQVDLQGLPSETGGASL